LNIYVSKKIYPISSDPIENGAIVTDGGKIVDIGTQKEIEKNFPCIPTNEICGSIIPAFVNSHTHLELNQFVGCVEIPQDMAPWILSVTAIIKERLVKPNFVNINISELKKHGICAVGDFSLIGESPRLLIEEGLYARVFHEIVSWQPEKLKKDFAICRKRKNKYPNTEKITNHFSPHAPHTVSKEMFEQIKISEKLFSIHLAESPAESQYLYDGTGGMAQNKRLLETVNQNWKPPKISPVQYFFQNNFVTDWTLLVHMVQTKDSDWEILEQNRDKIAVCLCPISNKNLSCGIAPGRKFLDKNFVVALGSDSTMSGETLDMIRLIKAAMNDYGFSFDEAIECATLGGAKALKMEKNIGSLEIGKDAQLLAYDGDSIRWIEGIGM